MTAARSFRLLTGGLILALASGVLGATAAQARPSRPGGVTGLTGSASAVASGYHVTSSWDAATNATSYRVSLVKAGTTLSSASVTTTSWAPSFTTSPGDATLSVQAVASHKPGPATKITIHLPDVTPPTASYEATWDNNTGLATLTQGTVADDAGLTGVTQTVDWGDGSGPQTWALGTPGVNHLTHTFPLEAHRYTPTVTVKDSSNNTTVVDVNAIVINDSEAPTGTFSAGPGSAWATLTPVTVTQSALSDNWSPADHITRTIDWGDGSVASPWVAGTTPTHVYAAGGTYTPQVHLVDEAGNSTIVDATAVTVSVDSVAPVLHLALPTRARTSVASWKTLHGTAKDTGGTGVLRVTVRAVEKRSGHWYGYNAGRRKWLKASSKAKAFARSRPATVRTDVHHAWAATLARLARGTLVYQVRAIDVVGNASKTLTHTARLTRR